MFDNWGSPRLRTQSLGEFFFEYEFSALLEKSKYDKICLNLRDWVRGYPRPVLFGAKAS